MGPLAAHDQPGTRRPGVQVDEAGELDHLGAVTSLERAAGAAVSSGGLGGDQNNTTLSWAKPRAIPHCDRCLPDENHT
jgi:hypothetical protein